MLCTAKYTNLSYLISENTFPQNVLKTDPGKLKATLNVTSSIKSYNLVVVINQKGIILSTKY